MSISLLLIISVVLYITDLPSCFSADQLYERCQLPLRCGSEPSLFPNITYPFWGNNIGKPNFCGQTGFELSCKKNQTLTLEIENITLRVISANLDNKTITVADDSLFEDGCPHIFNFTGAKQFTLNHNTELVDLFNCADNVSAKSLSKVSCQLRKENPITYHVFGSAHPPGNCTKVGEIPMLESAKNELRQANGSDQALKMALKKGFELRYDKEDKTCPVCTYTRGICGSESVSGSFRCLCTDKPHESSCNDGRGPNYEVKIGIGAAASVFGISAASLAWFVYHRRITKIYRTSSALLPRNPSDQFSKPSSDVEKAEELLAGVRLFSYEELEEATNSFDPSKELGDGGFGTVYYGKLKDGRSVAVKRLYENNFKRAMQFRNEVDILTGLRHPNLVTLFGCSSKQSRDLLLVYEYVANGTLADHLHGPHANPSSLPWSIRLKIAVETASALKYLHASEIIHRDVKSNNILLDQNFNVKDSRTWNLQALRTLVEPNDAKLIESIPLSRNQMEDRNGWHFTNNGKYSVQSGYQVERIYPDKEKPPDCYGPNVDILKAFCWKVKCPPKLRHFLWQLVTGCIAVTKNLKSRGIQGDTVCARCGDAEESINHVFFECPPARQVWALSKIPSNPNFFPTGSLFTNMDHLFWRVNPKMEDHQFAWILWYIWKGRNNKVFSNIDIEPRETLNLAELESRLWAEAQNINNPRVVPEVQLRLPLVTTGRWCFTDGSWKDKDVFSGQGWLSTLPGFEGLLGARNVRASLSPLHAEIEALTWAMECMKNLRQYQVTFATDCSQLVKMVSEPEEWPAFGSYLEDIKLLRRSFINSEIVHVSRTDNKMADRLARSARIQPSFVIHMDAELPLWFTESI